MDLKVALVPKASLACFAAMNNVDAIVIRDSIQQFYGWGEEVEIVGYDGDQSNGLSIIQKN